ARAPPRVPPAQRPRPRRRRARAARCRQSLAATRSARPRRSTDGCRTSRSLAGQVLLGEQLADLALAVAGHLEEPLRQFDGLLFRVRREDGEPADGLLALRERPVRDGGRSALAANRRGEPAAQAALRGAGPALPG